MTQWAAMCIVLLTCGFGRHGSAVKVRQATHRLTDTVALESILREMSPADVQKVLALAGYDDAILGRPRHSPPNSGQKYYEKTKATQCETVFMHGFSGMTEQEATAAAQNAPLSEFAELEATETDFPSNASANPETMKDLQCECETYKCTCRKDCYCRFV